MSQQSNSSSISTDERIISGSNGWVMLVSLLALFAFSLFFTMTPGPPIKLFGGILLAMLALFGCKGLFTLEPNQAAVMVFFGNYVGTVHESGFFWVNPFYNKTRVSLRINNWNTPVLKVNDERGSPIEIAAVIAWRVQDTARAIFDVESTLNYLQIQSESAVRQVASSHAYDDTEPGKAPLSVMKREDPRSGPDENPVMQLLENTFDFLEQIEGVARIGAWKLNPESGWLLWSKGIFELLGHPLAEPPSLETGMRYFSAPSRERATAAFADSWETGSPFQMNVDLVTRQGSPLLAELRCIGRVDRNHQSFLAGTFLDVTERHGMLERTLSTEARQRQWLATLPDGWLELSIEDKISLANRAAGAMFGMLPESMIGMRIEQLFPSLMDENLHVVNNQSFPVFQVLLSGCTPQPSPFGIKDRQGKLLWTEIHAAPLFDEWGALNGCSLLIRDINALRRIEQQQQQEPTGFKVGKRC